MGNNMWKKGFVIGIIIVFLGISVFSSVSGNIAIEKNDQNVVNTKIIDDSDTSSLRHVHKTYLFGRIFNLTYNETENDWNFEYHNLRVFEYYRYGLRYWEISFSHRGNVVGSYGIGGAVDFRGILTPSFICGCFYSTL